MVPSSASQLHPYTAWPASSAMALKPLTPLDRGMGLSSSGESLHSLTFADFVPGAKAMHQTEHEQLVDNTRKWVAQTFYGTLLKQMHDSPFKSEIFDGGRGGQAFSGLYDQQLAEKMARGRSSDRLVKAIVRKIEARQAYARQKKGGADAAPAANSTADATSSFRA